MVDVIISPMFMCIALVKEMQITHYVQEPVAWENFTNPGNGRDTTLVASYIFHSTPNLGKANGDFFLPTKFFSSSKVRSVHADLCFAGSVSNLAR